MVLGKQTETKVPDIANLCAFKFASGTGVMLHLGTWHDFPIAVEKKVTVLSITSLCVIKALTRYQVPQEIDDYENDILKLNVENALKLKLIIDCHAAQK